MPPATWHYIARQLAACSPQLQSRRGSQPEAEGEAEPMAVDHSGTDEPQQQGGVLGGEGKGAPTAAVDLTLSGASRGADRACSQSPPGVPAPNRPQGS